MVRLNSLGQILALGVLALVPGVVQASELNSQLDSLLPKTTVLDQDFQLDATAKHYVFIFLGVECPVARQYGARLQSFANEFGPHSIQFVGVNSNPQDSSAEVAQYSKDFRIEFPMLKDSSQSIAKHFSATRTAEVVVVDSSGKTSYRGRIDDQFLPGVARGKTTSHDLHNALKSLVSGTPIAVPETIPVGCAITYRKEVDKNPTVTFTRDVAPALWENCLECHRAGEIGPFDISDYDDLLGWGEMLVEVMEDRRMPPWHASPDHGKFKNERKLPDGMIELVRHWIDQGMPYGDPSDLPPKPEFTDGWRLPRDPDFVIEMRDRPFEVPADKTVDYQYFVVDPGFTEDKWVSAAQIVPGEPSVVHHSIVFIRPPDDGEFTGIGWLSAFVPGQVPAIFPPGYARKIPAGSKLVFQQHYTPSGTPQKDITKIGLNFIDESEVTHQVYALVALNQDFEIPPHAPAHVVNAKMSQFRKHGELMAIEPHMHLRGKAFEAYVLRGDQSETILKVPRYDFNWQHIYEYDQPIPLENVDDIRISVTFDNSKENPFNPNPDDYVMWGDQTWEEMAMAYFDVAVPVERATKVSVTMKELMDGSSDEWEESDGENGESRDEDRQAGSLSHEKFVMDFFAKHDSNKDGELQRDEVPWVLREFGFWAIDTNYDWKITREELTEAARNASRGNRGRKD